MHRDSAPRRAARILPQPRQLAALGTVLCLYRTQQRAALAGWTRAVRAEWSAGLDSDGMRESVWFFDRDDGLCWRLYLLPDSEFMAWDRLSRMLPTRAEPACNGGLRQRLWRRLADQLSGDSWYACPLRLHALDAATGPGTAAPPVLAASLVQPSTVGVAVAGRIAAAEGAGVVAFVTDERRVAAAQPASNHHALDGPLNFIDQGTRT